MRFHKVSEQPQSTYPLSTPENVPSTEAFLDSKGNRVQRCIEVWRRAGTRYSLYLLRLSLLNRWCIARDAFRSFRGHIQIQFATGRAGVDLGPLWERDSRGVSRQCIRTDARRLYIEKLSAIHPWVDGQDLRIFLMGFDAGEQYLDHSHGISVHTHSSDECSLWVSPSVLNSLQEIRAANGQISEAIPAAMAGVIRSDECTRTKL